MRRKKAPATQISRSWERRLYWRDGAVVDTETWHGGRLLPHTPRKLTALAVAADYCDAHRTRIYADLPCQFCGLRPGHDSPSNIVRRLTA
jgi:hypothetical protein